jgi:hypothetical protein
LYGLSQVARNPQSWIVGTFSAALTANMSGFAVLWAVPYMMWAHKLEMPVAAASVSLIMVGWAVGSPILGWLSDHIRRRKPPMLLAAIGASPSSTCPACRCRRPKGSFSRSGFAPAPCTLASSPAARTIRRPPPASPSPSSTPSSWPPAPPSSPSSAGSWTWAGTAAWRPGPGSMQRRPSRSPFCLWWSATSSASLWSFWCGKPTAATSIGTPENGGRKHHREHLPTTGRAHHRQRQRRSRYCSRCSLAHLPRAPEHGDSADRMIRVASAIRNVGKILYDDRFSSTQLSNLRATSTEQWAWRTTRAATEPRK